MAQEHLERLGPIDTSFLRLETATAHMHVGAVALFEGPAPGRDDVLDALQARLHLVPRCRQRPAFPPAGAGRPVWVDDASFDAGRHVHGTTLPAPGAEGALLDLAARIFSRPLDRSRPLWELWIVDGVDGGRFAVVGKVHHAMLDGIAGVDLAQALFDSARSPAPAGVPTGAWTPAPAPPPPTGVLAAGAAGLLRSAGHAATRGAAAAARPRATARAARAAAGGIRQVLRAARDAAPATPLDVAIGPRRRYAVARAELSDVQMVRDAYGGTVNDVVLAVVTGALRTWLQHRGALTEGLELRALVPVSVRGEHERGAMGNRLTVMRGTLPVGVDDPLARLRAVRGSMDRLKGSGQAAGAEMLIGLGRLAPPALLAYASRAALSARLFNLIVTNVPGPRSPLHLAQRRLIEAFPVAFLPPRHALAVGALSYDGALGFGLLGDHDALGDIETIAAGIEAALGELVALARR